MQHPDPSSMLLLLLWWCLLIVGVPARAPRTRLLAVPHKSRAVPQYGQVYVVREGERVRRAARRHEPSTDCGD